MGNRVGPHLPPQNHRCPTDLIQTQQTNKKYSQNNKQTKKMRNQKKKKKKKTQIGYGGTNLSGSSDGDAGTCIGAWRRRDERKVVRRIEKWH
jgi:hypothetical protein